MNIRRLPGLLTVLSAALIWVAPAVAIDEQLPAGDNLMRALADELDRTMTLQMEDLEKPYFAQFTVDDSLNYQLAAEYGALTSSQRSRSRTLNCGVRVGSYELDNTNFSEGRGFFSFGRRGGGGAARLPLDDDYLAIRQAIWGAADGVYKEAVETLTKKRAYMKDKNIADRPNDFTPAEPVEQIEPTATLSFDQKQWEQNLQQISAAFKRHEAVRESGVRLYVGAGNTYVVNSEGERLRFPDARALLIFTVQVQSDDGMMLSGGRSYVSAAAAELPAPEQIIKDIDELVEQLTAVRDAPVMELYTGPVLFDDTAAAQLFKEVLADGLTGRPDPVGEQRRGPGERDNLETKLDTRILPKSFQVWDDPGSADYDDQYLLGHYAYDDEGVPARRVDLVEDGMLKKLCMSRTPSKKLSGSNGHGRQASGEPQAAIGCLFIKDDDGVSDQELKKSLIEAARDAGLEYGVRIASIKSAGITSSQNDMMSMFRRRMRGGGGGGGGSNVGDPVLAYKVYVSDGHEEPFRGCEFGSFQIKELKNIAAAGEQPRVYNYIGIGMGGASAPATIVAPPVLFEELEIQKIEQEHDKPPLLKAPSFR